MQFYKKNSKLISSSLQFNTCLFLISLLFMGSCAGPQTALSEDQIAKKDPLTSVIESKTSAEVNPNTQKDSVDLSSVLELPIEVGQNETSPPTKSSNSNTPKQNNFGSTKLKDQKIKSNLLKNKPPIVEETFKSNQKEFPSNIENPLKNPLKKTLSKKTEESSETQWGLPDPNDSSDGIEIAQKPPFHPTQNLNDIYFDFDAFKLDQRSKTVLQVNAKWLSKNPITKLEIHGHCDERGTNNYNLALGEKRALTVKEFLTANGIASSRINTVSFGEEKPFCFEKSDECWKQNRRAHFLISKKSL
jgi:peptidoglycan-associated lipoprotein